MNRKMFFKAVLAFVLMFGCVLLKSIEVDAAQMGAENAQTTEMEILIDIPNGFYKDTATVTFQVVGSNENSPKIVSVKARAGRKGPYLDVMESMTLDITDDCTVYVVATDENGKNYERSRAIQCFDKEKPTLNAAVSEGMLSIKAMDAGSGIKKIIVNGYEYLDLNDGELNIRLSQFDGGYSVFEIQAEDMVGNLSEVYKTANPYHPTEGDDGNNQNPAAELPVSVSPTNPTSAQATVTDHVITDKDGKVINPRDLEQITLEGEEVEEIIIGKEFYTITTKSGKAFYLIIDHYGDSEQVRFLTEISENDLLNVTSNNSQSLPRNSAAVNSGITIEEAALPNNNLQAGYSQTKEVTAEELAQEEREEEQPIQKVDPKAEFIQKYGIYVAMGVIGLIVIVVGYRMKVSKRKQDEDDEEEESEYEDDKTVREEELDK